MGITKKLMLLSCLCGGLIHGGWAKDYKLFVLTGQSNSLGTTNGGETDPSSGSDPADQHVKFAWHNVVSATTSLGHSGLTLDPQQQTAVFTTLQDQQGGYYGGSATHWGPEIDFARTLYRAGVRDFGVIKVSRGGGGNTNWHKDSNGHMYTQVVQTVTEAVASLGPDDTFEIVGLLYLQGESDNSAETAIAGDRIKELTDNLRADLPNAANLRTVIAGTTAAGGASNTTKEATANATSYIDFFPNLDLTDRLSPDGLHLNKAGKFTVGNRFALAFLNAGLVNRHYGKLVFIGDSITQGGNGDRPSYRYQIFKNLATLNVANDALTGYEFVGSQTGGYRNSSITTPDVNGQTFNNVHDGHWGWRAFWENARIALSSGRYNTNNLGQGTLLNWTGQATTFETTDQGTLNYTGRTYVPDTVVMKIGINDLSGGSSATQVRDDIALMIDQLRTVNPNVRIFLNQVLYSNNVAYAPVDTLNGLLPQLVATKNAESSTSPIWFIEANKGFNPGTMTYDNTHPNALGEEYVGNRMSYGLGLIEEPAIATLPLDDAKDIANFEVTFDGSTIYDGTSYLNGWTEVNGSYVTETLTGTVLNRTHTGGAATWLEGQNATINGSEIWGGAAPNRVTFETSLRVNDAPNGMVLWIGTGSNAAIIEIYNDRTRDYGNNGFNVAHTNNDGQFHTFRVACDNEGGKYHVWRDGELLTPEEGVYFDSSSNDSRLIIGDYTGGTFGNNHNVDFAYITWDKTGAFPPVDNSNQPPTWNSNPINEINGTAGAAYNSTLTDNCVDPEGDALSYSLVFGPSWLTVSADGTMSGTPTASDIGENNWKVEVTDGFNPPAQATLNVIIEAAPAPEDKPLDSQFEGNSIYDGTNYINGWNEVNGSMVAETLNDTILNRVQNNGNGGTWLEGTNATIGDFGTWSAGNDGDWTFEATLRVNDAPNGFCFWLGTGLDVALIEIHNDRTQDHGAQGFNAAHTNNDGQFHTWRVTHNSTANKYHVWRDGVRLTPVDGVGFDLTNNDERLIIGDYTSGSFGNNQDVDFATISFDQTGAYEPVWNNAPIAANDTQTITEDATASILVLTNDSDADGDALTIQSVTTPSNGTATYLGDIITYTPNLDFYGEDVFSYTVTDGDKTATATVTVTITAVNDAPIAGDDQAFTIADQAITVDVLANDSDVEADPVSISAYTQGTQGAVDLVNGALVYTPIADFLAADSFTYTISDGQGGTTTATVNVYDNHITTDFEGADGFTVGSSLFALETTEDIFGTVWYSADGARLWNRSDIPPAGVQCLVLDGNQSTQFQISEVYNGVQNLTFDYASFSGSTNSTFTVWYDRLDGQGWQQAWSTTVTGLVPAWDSKPWPQVSVDLNLEGPVVLLFQTAGSKGVQIDTVSITPMP